MHPNAYSHARWGAGAVTAVVALAAATAVGWAATGRDPLVIVAPIAAILVFAASHSVVLRWRVLIGALLFVIFAIPIRRYTLPSGLPFELEPYRLLVLGLAVLWLACLLIEPERVRFPRTPLNVPIGFLLLVILVSVAANAGDISAQGIDDVAIKKVTFFCSFIVVAYLVGTVIRTKAEVDGVVKLLVFGGAALAFFAIVEGRTHVNVFDRLDVIPGLQRNFLETGPGLDLTRGRARAFASAQHPIALGAALALLLPLSLYVLQTTKRRLWWAAPVLIAAGAMSAVSRTPFLMMVAVGITLATLRPKDARRYAPAVLVMVVFIHAAVPGALGGIKSAFFPTGGLVAEQQKQAGGVGSGRLADLGPSLEEWSEKPLLGTGFGTRIVDAYDPRMNALILDNQWLTHLLETGALGLFALAWLLVRGVRRLRREAKRDQGPHGMLMAALAGSLTAYMVGMFTFDAFSFIQVTVLAFVLLGLTMSTAYRRPTRAAEPTRRPAAGHRRVPA